VLDGIALGLFDPKGTIAKATLAGLDAHLASPAGAGWSRNDDRYDHAGSTDLSPWGGEYDSAEWVFTDMRGAVATWLAGDATRSDRLLKWVRDQSLMNYLAVSETYDEGTGVYKFNAPMVGFGAGAFALAVAARGDAPDPACGAYLDEPMGAGGGGGASGMGGASGTGGGASGSGGATSGSSSGSFGAGGASPGDDGGCGCHAGPSSDATAFAAWLALGLALASRRRR
jgi:MYXO-CTERM domain-containing protein